MIVAASSDSDGSFEAGFEEAGTFLAAGRAFSRTMADPGGAAGGRSTVSVDAGAMTLEPVVALTAGVSATTGATWISAVVEVAAGSIR